ncbi:MAG: PQQ-dependent sugar dehydrogenase, partial [Proteobacteria bacterium]
DATDAVLRARLVEGKLVDVKDVWVGKALKGALGLTITPDAKLMIGTAGFANEDAQDPMNLNGKVLRLNDDGSVPKDNPFVGKGGGAPEVYTLGHRSPIAMTVHPGGTVYLAEMGPNGGDEINVLKPGANYGWPRVSLGRTYPGPWQAKQQEPTHAGYEPPIVYWTPSISVAGVTFYTGDKLAKWKGDLFVAGVRYGEIPGTGRIDRVLLNDRMEELRRESLLTELHVRIRDVQQGPDGFLYATVDAEKGAILRIEPAQ